MATWKPELHDADAVLNYYDQYDEAAYSVYAGHKPEQAYCRFTYTGNDKAIGREKLQEALMSVQSNPDNTNVYLLQVLVPKGKKLETTNAITFQLNKSQSLMPYQPQMMAGNSAMMQQLQAMESKINALQMQLETDEYEEEDDQPTEENFLGALMGNPAVKQMLVNVVANLLTPQAQTNIKHVAGIQEETEMDQDIDEQDNKIDEAIERLKAVNPTLGDDLLRLCVIAEEDPKQFAMLLKMLRM